ncbi:hypothetical protein MCEMIH22_01318 [Candidatus Methylacidiphilaceae bacterium]
MNRAFSFYLISLFIQPSCALSAEKSLNEIVETPFKKVIVIQSKQAPIEAEKIKTTDQHLEIIDLNEKLILCKNTDVIEIACLFPGENFSGKSDYLKKALELFPKDGSRLSKDPRFSPEIKAKWELLLREALQKEEEDKLNQLQTQERIKNESLQRAEMEKKQRYITIKGKLTSDLILFGETYPGNGEGIMIFDPKVNPGGFQNDYNGAFAQYSMIANKNTEGNRRLASKYAFKILTYLVLLNPDGFTDQIIGNNTKYKSVVELDEVLQIFYEALIKNQSSDKKLQTELEERRRIVTAK